MESKWKMVFDGMVMVVILYTSITTFFYIMYEETPEDGSIWSTIDNIITMIFAADFFLKFFCEF